MENINKALIMGGQILIFVVGISVGIFLYQTLINTQENILIASEEYSRDSERLSRDENYDRIIKGSEILGTIMASIENTDMSAVINKEDFNPDQIEIQGVELNNKPKTIDLQYFKSALYDSDQQSLDLSEMSQINLFKPTTSNFNYDGNYKLTYKTTSNGEVIAVFTEQ